MSRREFRLHERDAAAHSWASAANSAHVVCKRCGLVAEVLEETYFCVYPAHTAQECCRGPEIPMTWSLDAIEPSLAVLDVSAPGMPYVVEAEIRSVRLRFTSASRPAFIVAVLGALERS
jgi:hypothetical protein